MRGGVGRGEEWGGKGRKGKRRVVKRRRISARRFHCVTTALLH